MGTSKAPASPSLTLPPLLAPAHPDHCAPRGVQEINGCMLTTFDRLHKGGHLGSHDATVHAPLNTRTHIPTSGAAGRQSGSTQEVNTHQSLSQ